MGKTPPPQTAGEVLRQIREAQGLTQYALAKRAGVSPQALAAIEGGRKPTFDAVRRLCAALEISVQEVSSRLPAVELEEPARPHRGRPKADG
jgi:transcriptional regulator with XRE-family HTH domain